MKKLLTALSIGVLSIGVLAACNSDENGTEPTDETEEPVEEGNGSEAGNEDDPGNEENGDDAGDELDNGDSDDSPGDSNDGPVSTGEYDNQTELRLGDTGQIATTTGEFEVTLESVRQEDEVDGEVSMFDFFIVTDLTIKNIGDATIDIAESIDVLENTDDLEGSGSGDYSSEFESIDGLSGELAPGEEASGEAIFDVRTGDTQYIRVRSGLVAAGAVKKMKPLGRLKWTKSSKGKILIADDLAIGKLEAPKGES